MPRSGIRVILDLAQRSGVIHLEIGQPDFPTPTHIVEAADAAARAGYTGYTANAGLPELREAISSTIARDNGVETSPDHVVVTVGAMGALYAASVAVLEPGDQVLVPDPGYPNYQMAATLCGSESICYPLLPENGYQPDLEALHAMIGPRSKAIIVNSPSNPTGAVLSEASLQAVVDLAERHDLYVISDECYEKILFDGAHISAASLAPGSDRFFTISSVSKSYAMTGWRLGYVVAPAPIAPHLAKLQESMVSCAPILSQHAAIAALTGPQDAVDEMCAAYRRRRDLAVELLRPHGLCRYQPGGAFYLLLDLPGDVTDTYEYSKRLLCERDVAVAPGETFGARGAGRVRISLANSEELLREGIERLIEFALGIG